MDQYSLLQDVVNFIENPDTYTQSEALRISLIENKNSQTNQEVAQLGFLVGTNEINDNDLKTLALNLIAKIAPIETIEYLPLSLDDLSKIHSFALTHERDDGFKESLAEMIENSIKNSSDISQIFDLNYYSNQTSLPQSQIDLLPGEDGPVPESRLISSNALQPVPEINNSRWIIGLGARRLLGSHNDLIL